MNCNLIYTHEHPRWIITAANKFLEKHNCGWQIEASYKKNTAIPEITGPDDKKTISTVWLSSLAKGFVVYTTPHAEYLKLHPSIWRVYGHAGTNFVVVNTTDKYVYWDRDEKVTSSLSKAQKHDLWLPQPVWTLFHELIHALLPHYSPQKGHDLIDAGFLITLLKEIGANKIDMIDWNSDEDILTRTLVGEYGHGTDEDMFAVGCVIRNRAWQRNGFASTVKGVCLQPKQFSCWNHGTPDRERLINLKRTSYVYQKANKVAKEILSGSADTTRNADHYLNIEVTKKLYGKIPTWVDPSRQTTKIGDHTFYNLNGSWVENREATTKEPTIYRKLGEVAYKLLIAKQLTTKQFTDFIATLTKLKHADS